MNKKPTKSKGKRRMNPRMIICGLLGLACAGFSVPLWIMLCGEPATSVVEGLAGLIVLVQAVSLSAAACVFFRVAWEYRT